MEISHAFDSRKEAAAGRLSLWSRCACIISTVDCCLQITKSNSIISSIIHFVSILTKRISKADFINCFIWNLGLIARQSWSEDNYIELQDWSRGPWQPTMSCHSQGPLICYWPWGGPLIVLALINYRPDSGMPVCHNQMVTVGCSLSLSI